MSGFVLVVVERRNGCKKAGSGGWEEWKDRWMIADRIVIMISRLA